MLQSSIWDKLPNPAASLMETFYEKVLGNGLDSDLLPPKKFVEDEMTSFFVENGSTILLTNFSLLLLLLMISSSKRIRTLKNNKILKTIKIYLKWNILARTFLENGIPLALAILLQLRALSFDGTYFVICSIMTIMASAYFIAAITFSFKVLYQRNNKELELNLARKVYRTLYEGVILKDHAKYYHLALLARGILVVFLITMVEDLPALQILSLILFDVLFVLYLFKSVEMEDYKLNIIIKAKEILILAGEVGILFLSFETTSENYYKITGWIVVGFFVTGILIEICYMILLQILGIKEIKRKIISSFQTIKFYLSKKRKGKLRSPRVRIRRFNESTVISENTSLEN